MVISCAAVNCTNRQGKVDKAEISFHRFPINNAGRLAKWKQAVRRANWMPNKYSFLCSKHFAPDCFHLRHEDQQRQLKDSAVPSIFDFTLKDRVSRGSVRKKLLSAGELGTKEEEEPESVHGLMTIPPSLVGPHQPEGEWSLGGEKEIFTPPSCSLIDALHSYSSISRQERERRSCSPYKTAAHGGSISCLLSNPGHRCRRKNEHELHDVRRRKWRIRWQLRVKASRLRAVLYKRKMRRRLLEVIEEGCNHGMSRYRIPDDKTP
ncbi:hypothetical protein JZ751_013736 [Albula glossodonta]|uniref:THAP-type domain-containing protein n=1 Tax=Albula glossodonta TaxID=121402 RepID=A0A8T2P4I6_9TELE|nr:hypothetical protein JZ751_013736 [Albula glossodonta]